jgi:hypothetical protein
VCVPRRQCSSADCPKNQLSEGGSISAQTANHADRSNCRPLLLFRPAELHDGLEESQTMLVMAINRECSTAHFALIISVTFKYLHQPLPPISTSNITSLASPSFLTQKMYFTVNLIAALMLAISVQSRGRPGTDPNQAFSCTSTPQCTTGVCIAKTGPNTYAGKSSMPCHSQLT